jgi:CBS domain-containing protein
MGSCSVKNAKLSSRVNTRTDYVWEQDGLRVQDVMNRNHPSIYPDELVTKARAVLRNFKLRILPVVNDGKRLLGVVSRNDIMTISSSVSVVRVKGIMAAVKFVATLDMDVVEAAQEMLRADEWYVPVTKSQHDNSYVGVLGLEHIIKSFYEKKAQRLKMPLSDVMSTKELLICSPDDEVDNIWHMMKERSFAACPVVAKGKIVGIMTLQNLLESGTTLPGFEAKKGRFKAHSTINGIMRTLVFSLRPDNTVGDAAKLMVERDIGRVPITNSKGQLVGIVDREDILKAMIKQPER